LRGLLLCLLVLSRDFGTSAARIIWDSQQKFRESNFSILSVQFLRFLFFFFFQLHSNTWAILVPSETLTKSSLSKILSIIFSYTTMQFRVFVTFIFIVLNFLVDIFWRINLFFGRIAIAFRGHS
jgi:hypothetical protein